ncbi:uncharacterized protein LOC144113042 [Amblyomma americanum]
MREQTCERQHMGTTNSQPTRLQRCLALPLTSGSRPHSRPHRNAWGAPATEPTTPFKNTINRDGKPSSRALYWLFRVERLPTVQPYISLVIARALKTDGSLKQRTRKAWSSVSPRNLAQHQRFTVGYRRRFLPLGPHLAVVTVTASIMEPYLPLCRSTCLDD